MASWRWAEYSDYVIICGMGAFAATIKLLFHKAHWLSNHFPESCVLIVLGVVMGQLVSLTQNAFPE